MFGPRLTRVFASRNNALWWSAMVLITAYCVAAEPPAKPLTEAGEKVSDEDMPQSDKQSAAQKKPGDPWADMKDVAQKRGELLR